MTRITQMLFFIGLLLSFCKNVNAQLHPIQTGTRYCLTDSANFRLAPSTQSNIIDKIRTGTLLEVDEKDSSRVGTVNGVSSYWIPVIYKGKKGFVWKSNFALGRVICSSDSTSVLLFGLNSKKDIEFVLLKRNQLRYRKSFVKKELNSDYISFYNYGQTYFSQGNDVLSIGNSEGFVTFLFNNQTINVYDAPLPDRGMFSATTQRYPFIFINRDKVNFRSGPSVRSKIIQTFKKDDRIRFEEYELEADSVNGENGYWLKIKVNGRTGYFWSKYLDVPIDFKRSFVNRDETVVLTHQAIYILDGESVLLRKEFDASPFYLSLEFSSCSLSLVGDLGFKGGVQFIALCFTANSCGESGGDKLFLRRNNQLRYFLDDYGIGDGGYSTGSTYTYPIEHQKGQNTVEYSYYETESVTQLDANYPFPPPGIFSDCNLVYQLVEDSLVLQETPVVKLDKVLKVQTKNKFRSSLAFFVDVNEDGQQDVFSLIQPNYGTETIQDEKQGIAFSFGDNLGGFKSFEMNRSLIDDETYSVGFDTIGDTVRLAVYYYLGMEFEPNIERAEADDVEAENELNEDTSVDEDLEEEESLEELEDEYDNSGEYVESDTNGEGTNENIIPHLSLFYFVYNPKTKKVECVKKEDYDGSYNSEYELKWELYDTHFFSERNSFLEIEEDKTFDR